MTSHLPPYDLTRLRSLSSDPSKERAALLALSRAALAAERWDDLLRFARELVRVAGQATPGADLTPEERHIFFTASKQVLSGLRAAWRHCKVEDVKDVTDEFRLQLERELLAQCTDLTSLIESTLLRSVKSPEPQVFWRKMCGDLYRYLAEVSVPNAAVLPYALAAPQAATQSASSVIPLGFDKRAVECYTVAMRLATTHLEATHPTRLGLCLNYSVLLLEIAKDKKGACELARQAFDAAIAKLDDLEESTYKDTTLLMQLLRDNITLWTAHDQPINETPK